MPDARGPDDLPRGKSGKASADQRVGAGQTAVVLAAGAGERSSDRPSSSMRKYLRFLRPSVTDHSPTRYWRARVIDFAIVLAIAGLVAWIVYMTYRAWGVFLR
ncbi:MAG TPA: hypothetical protein VGQ63_06680 [Pseudolabrys sp.]|jgi:hypothetical protein|nr:hypothetical protein [Pseudolabrys sp.]